MASVPLHVPLCMVGMEVPRNTGQAGTSVFAITTLPAGRGGAELAPGSPSLQLTEWRCAAPSDCQHWGIFTAPLSPITQRGS